MVSNFKASGWPLSFSRFFFSQRSHARQRLQLLRQKKIREMTTATKLQYNLPSSLQTTASKKTHLHMYDLQFMLYTSLYWITYPEIAQERRQDQEKNAKIFTAKFTLRVCLNCSSNTQQRHLENGEVSVALNWVVNAQQCFADIYYHWTQGCSLPCVQPLRTQSKIQMLTTFCQNRTRFHQGLFKSLGL